MAKKLPKYEKTAGFNYEGMAQLTDVVTRQEAATGERINKFLSGVTQDFRQQVFSMLLTKQLKMQ